jgi:hypothetical protein
MSQELPIYQEFLDETSDKNNRLIARDLYVIGHCVMIWFLLFWFVLSYLDHSHRYVAYSCIFTSMLLGTTGLICRESYHTSMRGFY